MTYKSPPIGNEISCVMHGIKREILGNNKGLKNSLLKALEKEKFTILDKISYEFKPKGYTLLVLLAESHATIHTYPEHNNSLYFNIYSCRGPRDGRKTYEHLKKELNPSRISDYTEKEIAVGENKNNFKS